jgi:hypothetical protein
MQADLESRIGSRQMFQCRHSRRCIHSPGKFTSSFSDPLSEVLQCILLHKNVYCYKHLITSLLATAPRELFLPISKGNIWIHEEYAMVQYEISVEKFGSLSVYNDSEEAVKLSSLWQKQTAVLVFVRHFG